MHPPADGMAKPAQTPRRRSDVIPVDGGEATKLSDHKGNIKSFEWAKDGASIVFLAERAKSDAQKAAEKAGDDAIFVDEGPNGQERSDHRTVADFAGRQDREQDHARRTTADRRLPRLS